MVTRPLGHGSSAPVTAARTRSFACESAASGRPTSTVRGRPPPSATSTSTIAPSIPLSATDQADAVLIPQSPGRD